MSSKRCPNCGLVNFASASTCKRCNKELGAADASSPQIYRKPNPESAVSSKLVPTIITIILLSINVYLAYGRVSRSTKPTAEAIGEGVGSAIAWPLLLIVIYVVSKKFRQQYSAHTVINYGLAINAVINITLWLAAP